MSHGTTAQTASSLDRLEHKDCKTRISYMLSYVLSVQMYFPMLCCFMYILCNCIILNVVLCTFCAIVIFLNVVLCTFCAILLSIMSSYVLSVQLYFPKCRLMYFLCNCVFLIILGKFLMLWQEFQKVVQRLVQDSIMGVKAVEVHVSDDDRLCGCP